MKNHAGILLPNATVSWDRVSSLLSRSARFWNPVADKLMVIAALIVLVWLDRADASLAIIIIGREIAISALREWMAQLGKAKSVAVAFIGKVKTVAQITAIIALLLYQPVIPGINTIWLGTIALWLRDPDAVVDVSLSSPCRAACRGKRCPTPAARLISCATLVGVLAEIRAMLAGVINLLDDSSKPAKPDEIKKLVRNIQELTIITETEMNKKNLSCKRARSQLLEQIPATKPTLH